MLDKTNILFRQSIVVRFSGDSGDGMQLAGNIFSNISAERGDQISTFPTIQQKCALLKVRSMAFLVSKFMWDSVFTLLVMNVMC